MIIISKEYDYYDKIQAHGLDKDLRFIRKSSEITNALEIPSNLIKMLRGLPDKFDYWDNSVKLIIRPFIIIFCGHIYLGYHLILKDCSNNDLPDIYVYDLNSLEKVLKKYDPVGYSGYLKKGRFLQFSTSFKKSNLLNVFQEYKNKKIDIDIHLDQRAPILYIGYDNRRVIYKKNPLLRELEFYKKINAYTAFQEISMFIGGVVSKEFPPTVELKEKDKIMKKGFDKWSFRKMGKYSK